MTHYGDPNEFEYKEFIPQFTGENFDAKEWAELCDNAGARYVQPIAIFCDGFPMYNSQLQPVNCVNEGLHFDYLEKLKQEVERKGMHFCASSHYAENYWFYNQKKNKPNWKQDKSIYGPCEFTDEISPTAKNCLDVIEREVDEEFLKNWLVYSCEIIDHYQPSAFYLDWWTAVLAFKPYLKKLAAYYYNRALSWNKEVVLIYKNHSFAPGCALFDKERGSSDTISYRPWQCDTSISRTSWGYTAEENYKTTEDILCNMIDVVSKNGCFLLNIGPKADGTISDGEKKILNEIGMWMRINGEGIYDSQPWHISAEGDTKFREGGLTDEPRTDFTETDYRFTYKAGNLYVYLLNIRKDSVVCIKTLAKKVLKHEMGIECIQLLEEGSLNVVKRDEHELYLSITRKTSSKLPVCIKISLI